MANLETRLPGFLLDTIRTRLRTGASADISNRVKTLKVSRSRNFHIQSDKMTILFFSFRYNNLCKAVSFPSIHNNFYSIS